MVEIIDRVLQLAEDGLLPRPLLRDVGDDPRRERAAARPRQWSRLDAIPARPDRRLVGSGDRRRHAHFLLRSHALAKALRNAVDRLRGFGVAGESALDRAQARLIGGA